MSLIPYSSVIASAGHQAAAYINTADATGLSGSWNMIGSYIGPAQLPGWELNDNFQPIEGIGWFRDIEQVPGRFEPTVNGQLNIVNPTDLVTTAVRNGTTGFLPAFAFKIVTAQHIVTFTYAYFQDLRFQGQENGDVNATFSIQSLFATLVAGDGTVVVVPHQAGGVLRWQHVRTLTVGGEDMRNFLSSFNVGIQNNIQRVGMRTDNDALYPRGALTMIPGVEKLQVSYNMHTTLLTPADAARTMGSTVITIQPASGTHSLVMTIANNHMSRRSAQQAGANAIIAYSCDVAAYALSFSTSPA